MSQKIRAMVAFLFLAVFSQTVIAQTCNKVNAVTSASLKITGGSACATTAAITYSFPESNGTLAIKWGKTTAYGSEKSMYPKSTANLTGLTPATTYYYHCYSIWQGSTKQYMSSSFTTASNAAPNNPPVITSAKAESCTTGAKKTYTVTATDANNDKITFTASGMPAWITFASPTLTMSPTSTSKNCTVKIIASDSNGGLDTVDLAVNVVFSVAAITKGSIASYQSITIGRTLITIPNKGENSLAITLYQCDGTLILKKIVNKGKNDFSVGSLKGIQPGMYIAKIGMRSGAITQKVSIGQ